MHLRTRTWAAILALAATGPTFADPVPILEYRFNTTGTSEASTGSSTDAITFYNYVQYSGSFPNYGPAADLHGAPGSGVSGLASDRAFDLSNTVAGTSQGTTNAGTPSTDGGIAVNSTSAALQPGGQGLMSWTISGWYKKNAAGPAPVGGTALFMAPGHFNDTTVSGQSPDSGLTPPPGGTGLGTTGFAVRWNGPTSLRTNVSNINQSSSLAASVSGGSSTMFDAVNQWTFFAVTYDGTKPDQNIFYYEGYRTGEGALLGRADAVTLLNLVGQTISLGGFAVTGAMLTADNGFAIGNRLMSTTDGGRAFPGLLDDIRVYGSTTDGSGALALSDLESLRTFDLQGFVPVPEPGPVMAAALAAAAVGLWFRRRLQAA